MSRLILASVLALALLAAYLNAAPIGHSAPPLAVTQYRAQASAICEAANRKLNNHAPQGSASQKLVQEAEFDGKTAQTAYIALARLVPPLRLARLHDKVIADMSALVGDFPLLVDAAKKGIAAYKRAYTRMDTTRVQNLERDEAALWTKLGVPACNA
jgi:hypothetical protein